MLRSCSETVELGSRSHGAIVKGERDMWHGLVGVKVLHL
jgi:hypothetical protein